MFNSGKYSRRNDTPTRLLKIRGLSESNAPGGYRLPNLEEFRHQCPFRIPHEQALGSDWVHATDSNDAAHVSQHPWKRPAALLLHQLQYELSDHPYGSLSLWDNFVPHQAECVFQGVR